MDDRIHWADKDVIGALRLGIEAAATEKDALILVKRLLEQAQPTPADAMAPTRLLIDVIRESGNFEVTAVS